MPEDPTPKEEFLEDPDARRPIPSGRVAIAAVLVVFLIFLSMLYHDGVIATDDLDEVGQDGGVYRLRGTASQVGDDSFLLTADGSSVPVRWNLTTPPAEGATVVVNGVWNATAEALEGEAVVQALIFR